MTPDPIADFSNAISRLTTVLLITLVVLVVISIVLYNLSSAARAAFIGIVIALVFIIGLLFGAADKWGWNAVGAFGAVVAGVTVTFLYAYRCHTSEYVPSTTVAIIFTISTLALGAYLCWPLSPWLWALVVLPIGGFFAGDHLGFRVYNTRQQQYAREQQRERDEGLKRQHERAKTKQIEEQRSTEAAREDVRRAEARSRQAEKVQLEAAAARAAETQRRSDQAVERRRQEDVRSAQTKALEESRASDDASRVDAAQRLEWIADLTNAVFENTDGGRRSVELITLSQKVGQPTARVLRLLHTLRDQKRVSIHCRDDRYSWEVQEVQLTASGVKDIISSHGKSVRKPMDGRLRVLYLTSDPTQRLRLDEEVRRVQEQVRRSIHRDGIRIEPRPAATGLDIINGLNDLRPQVVHFSGHSDTTSLLVNTEHFGDHQTNNTLSYRDLADSLKATGTPPRLVVLASCDSASEAGMLLEAADAVVAITSKVTDIAASAFAAYFYSAIAAGQSIKHAVDQGSFAIRMFVKDEGWKPIVVTRPEFSADQIVLVAE